MPARRMGRFNEASIAKYRAYIAHGTIPPATALEPTS